MIPTIFQLFETGISGVPYGWTIVKTLAFIAVVYVLKKWFAGATNGAERLMHGKVVMMTGATAGVGAAVARELASRGAQLVILTQHSLSDPFLVDYILDLRESTGNELVTAEHCDLSSLHSIRTFATKWIDNAPPRRLDMIILCANTFTPAGGKVTPTIDSLESTWAVNYLANFHLLSILSPAIRAQPPDRDVRIIFGMCSSYMGGQLPDFIMRTSSSSGSKPSKSKGAKQLPDVASTEIQSTSPYATSKFSLMTFAYAFQSHLWSYDRPDKNPMNARVILVDPGWCRTPGMRRFLTFGSLWGLLVYLITWPFWWLVLKSPDQGAQSFLLASMDAEYGRGEGGWLIKECRQIEMVRKDCKDEGCQKDLWQGSEKMIEAFEKEGAVRRAKEKKEREEAEAREKAKSAEPKTPAEKQPGSRRSKKA